MPTPTDEQLREYAAKLPAIYRDILAAFPGAAPERRAGDGLFGPTIEDHVEGLEAGHRSGDIVAGLGRLTERGFLERGRELATYTPTPVGERLIQIITGHVPASDAIPELPVPTWG